MPTRETPIMGNVIHIDMDGAGDWHPAIVRKVTDTNIILVQVFAFNRSEYTQVELKSKRWRWLPSVTPTFHEVEE